MPRPNLAMTDCVHGNGAGSSPAWLLCDADPTQTVTSNADPTQTETGNADPTQTETSNADPTQTETGNADPTQTETGNADPTQTEQSNADPTQTGKRIHASSRGCMGLLVSGRRPGRGFLASCPMRVDERRHAGEME